MAAKKTPNYRYRVEGYDGDWKDWDKLPSSTDHAIQRKFTKKADAMKAAKEWMAKHPPSKKFHTNRHGDTITPYIHIWNMSRGHTETKWIPEGGQWVDQDTWLKMRRENNPKKKGSRSKNTHDSSYSAVVFNSALLAADRELDAAVTALDKGRVASSIQHLVEAGYWTGQARCQREYSAGSNLDNKLWKQLDGRLRELEFSMKQWGKNFEDWMKKR